MATVVENKFSSLWAAKSLFPLSSHEDLIPVIHVLWFLGSCSSTGMKSAASRRLHTDENSAACIQLGPSSTEPAGDPKSRVCVLLHCTGSLYTQFFMFSSTPAIFTATAQLNTNTVAGTQRRTWPLLKEINSQRQDIQMLITSQDEWKPNCVFRRFISVIHSPQRASLR